MPDSLGDLIKRRRAELGMTQARLAELVGKSASAVRSWERDRAAPKGDATRGALAAVLGITNDELDAAIGGADISFFSDPGRPIAADPTPTIVMRATDSDAAADRGSEVVLDDETGVEAAVPQDRTSSPSQAEAHPPGDEHVRRVSEIPDSDVESVDAYESESLRESEADSSEFESVVASESESARESEADSSEFASEPGSDQSESESESESESQSESEPSEPDVEAESEATDGEAEPELTEAPRELVGVGAVPSQASSEGVATRLVARPASVSRPEAILAPAPSVEADPVSQDAWLYRRRLLLLGAAAVVLIVVLRWALSGVGDAISEVLDNLRTGA